MLRRVTLENGRGSDQIGGCGRLPPSVLAIALGTLLTDRQGTVTTSAVVEQLCDALVGDQPGAGKAFVERLLACGISVDALYDTFIPRTAARLGDLWLEDVISFTAVTLGMARLTEVFRGLSPTYMKGRRPIGRDRRALFALVPGEEHALGVVVAADQFQRAGWIVQVELQASAARLEDLVGSQPFELVGLSAGSRRMLPALEATVARLRGATAPGTRFAIGGALVRAEPTLVRRLGADLDGTNVKDALYELERTV
jgi:MerR family transcriptional regulator, light-induced transcriptional regulator